MEKKILAIITLAIALVIAIGYIAYNIWFTEFISSCRQEGINNTLQGIVDQVKLRGTAIQIKVGQEQLICSTKTLIGE